MLLSYTETGAIILVACCLFVIFDPYWFRSAKACNAQRRPDRLPVWVPLEGYLASIVVNSDGMLQKFIHYLFGTNDTPFGLTSKHSVIHTPSMVKHVLQQPSRTVNNEAILWNLIIKIFGGNDRLRSAFSAAKKELDTAITRNFLREEPVAKATQVTVQRLQELAPVMMTFSFSAADQNLWERTASVSLPQGKTNPGSSPEIVEASLFPLIRNFVGHVSLPTLMGTRFMESYPTVLDDLWDLDDAFNLLVVGVPEWLPITVMKKAKVARTRLNDALAKFHVELDKEAAGEKTGDLSDVSVVMKERSQAHRIYGIAAVDRGPLDLGLLWAMNANANSLVFWILTYIWAVPGLVTEVRQETDPYTGVHQPAPSSDSPKNAQLNINTEAILRSCPILKACYLETLRLTHEPTSIRHIQEDFHLHTPKSPHPLKAGTFITMPHSIHQHDPHVFPHPTLFNKNRFLNRDAESGGALVARYGTLKPWGGGQAMCKGRIFAEREVLVIVVGIVALWDFEPVGRVPGQRKATGVNYPKEECRVVVRRRQFG